MDRYYKVILILIAISLVPFSQHSSIYMQPNLKTHQFKANEIILASDGKLFPIINITLANGTVFNFTTVDDAIRFLYQKLTSKAINYTNIANITVIRFNEYLDLMENKTNTTSPIPAYRAFFVKVPYLNKYNYTGNIIPVMENETLLYGSLMKRNLIYGPIGNLNITDITGANYVLSGSLNLIVFIDSNRANTSLMQIRDIESNLKLFQSENVNILVVDVNENITKTIEFVDNFNITLPVANDYNITIGTNTTGLYGQLGFSKFIPATVIINSDGIVLRKNIGFETSSSIIGDIKLLKKGLNGVLQYTIKDVYIEKAKVDTTSDIVVVLSDGFGNIEQLNVTYSFVFSNGTVSPAKEIQLKTTDEVTYRSAIYIPKDTKMVKINATLKTEFGLDSKSIEIEIEQINTSSGGQETPIVQILIVVALILIMIIGYVSYRRLGK